MGCEHSLDIRIEGIKHGTIVNSSDFHYFDLHADEVTHTYKKKGFKSDLHISALQCSLAH